MRSKIEENSNMLRECVLLLDKNEQYTKIENLLIHGLTGVPNYKGYLFSTWVADMINMLIPNLDFAISPEHISISHPLRNNDEMTKVVIVRFVNRDVRNEIFYKKKWITNSNVYITEHLTKRNLDLLKKTKALVGPKNAWSSQTKLFCKVGDKKMPIMCENDLIVLKDLKDNYDSLSPADTVTSPNESSSDTKPKTPVLPTTAVIDTATAEHPNNFNLLKQTWPNLSEADILEIISNQQNKKQNNSKGAVSHRSGNRHGGRGRAFYRGITGRQMHY